MADSAAICVRSGPVPLPMAMSAAPLRVMMDRMSAKSRLISPGVVMRLATPPIPWCKVSSAI